MAQVIRLKRTNTAGKVPTTADLTSGEVGVNMADQKVYINRAGTITLIGVADLVALEDVVTSNLKAGQTLVWDGTKFVNVVPATYQMIDAGII